MIDIDLFDTLAEELQAALRLRDAADPDAPPWEAAAEAHRLEQLIGALLLEGLDRKDAD